MDGGPRRVFNANTSEKLTESLKQKLFDRVGVVPFRVAETPLFLSEKMRARFTSAATEIVAQLSAPTALSAMRAAVPAHYDVPGAPALPDCVQIDFALTHGDIDGGLDIRVVELQAFPSLYAFEAMLAQAWWQAFEDVPDLAGSWACFFDGSFEENLKRIERTIVGGCDPERVVLVDIAPEQQKTVPDFVATKRLFNIDSVCLTKIKREGRRLLREKDGRQIPIDRIYNRIVFDELETKKISAPFDWRDDLDLTWCSHPNWYWIWSKNSLPHLDHVCVPKTVYASDPIVDSLEDLSAYVLKPLFSYAGMGVKVDVTREDIAKIPQADRGRWILQKKVEYAPAIEAPDGAGVKAEVRVMLMREPSSSVLEPLLPLVRLSRGKLLGVDHNKDLLWTGASVGIWRRD